MRNLVLDPDCIENNRVVVDGELYHYLKDVRRVREGSRIDALIGRRHYSLVVTSIITGRIVFGIETSRDTHSRYVSITVYQGLLKSKKMDLVISKLAEIGVGDFFPLKMERTIPQIKLESEKISRWRRLVREAAKVSGYEDVMNVHDPATLVDAVGVVERAGGGTVLLFNASGSGEHLMPFLQKLSVEGKPSFHLFFGPEGGFTDEEIDTVSGMGGALITMGEYTMRAETASIIGAGFIRIFYSGRQ
jgi:16S rRNA (uracil1498-N3)-methyltransferase